jgi:acyl carrier protein
VNREDVLDLIARALDIDREQLTPASKAADFAAWDSMGTMQILLALDAACGLQLSPGETGQLTSVAGIVGLLEKTGKLS